MLVQIAKKSKFQIFGFYILMVLLACRQPKTKDVGLRPFGKVDSLQIEMVLADMKLEEKIAQLVIWEGEPESDGSHLPTFSKITQSRIGGVILKNFSLYEYLVLTDSLRRNSKLPLFFGTTEKVSLHNQFSGLTRFPKPASLAAIDSFALQADIENRLIAQFQLLGINFCMAPALATDQISDAGFNYETFENEEKSLTERAGRMLARLREKRIVGAGDHLRSLFFTTNDSLRNARLHTLVTQSKAGLGAVLVHDEVFTLDTLEESPPLFVKKYLHRYLNFNGLMVVRLGKDESPEKKFFQGADLMITRQPEKIVQQLLNLVEEGKINLKDIEQRTRLVLQAKAWIYDGRLPVKLTVFPIDSIRQPVRLMSVSEKSSPRVYAPYQTRSTHFEDWAQEVVCYFEDPAWGYVAEQLFERSVILAADDKQLLPLPNASGHHFRIIAYSNQSHFGVFRDYFERYVPLRQFEIQKIPSSRQLSPVHGNKSEPDAVVVVLLDGIDLQEASHSPFLESVNKLAGAAKVVLVNFGNPKNLRFFMPEVACVQVFERNKFTEAWAAQMLFGGVASVGKLPLNSDDTDTRIGITRSAVRLGFAAPEQVGISTEKLAGVASIIESAIRKHAFPGCQIVLAKNGRLFYSEAFGHHHYGKNGRTVRKSDIYDIASVTKIAATTLAAMKLSEEGRLELERTVGEYLTLDPSLPVSSIRIRELLFHQSGLQPQMPLSRLYNGKNIPAKGCNEYYCRQRKGDYTVKVADGLYLRRDYHDTIFQRVVRLPVGKKRFRYGDVNFFLLHKVIEKQSGQNLDEFVSEKFYKPLGLSHTCFSPLEKFPREQIIPTERDDYWRKTLVHGYVHDPAAALLGGVSGNSGLFANAEDLAVLFQMLVQHGSYGGQIYLQKSTVETFTKSQKGSHRGLGFDKPHKRRYPTYSASISEKGYGHTGFTGSCVWVDPNEELIYVFLSNRIHPSARNAKIFTEEIRSRVHDVVYEALGSFSVKIPQLPDALRNDLPEDETDRM